MSAAADRIAAHLREIGADVERTGEGALAVRVPCASRGAIVAGIRCGERTLAVRAFVMRGPDRAHEAVYRRLLRKGLTTRYWRFALDDHGDVVAAAELPSEPADPARVDELLGALASLVDETYEGLARTGFDVPPDTRFAPPPAADESR